MGLLFVKDVRFLLTNCLILTKETMANEIAKFSLEDEKLLLSEMEMLEVYGGAVSSSSTYQVANGCKCPAYACGLCTGTQLPLDPSGNGSSGTSDSSGTNN